MSHRYQTEAAIKLVGGVRYSYALRGDGQTVTELVPGDEQRAALDVILQTLSAETLMLSEEIIAQMPPRAYGDRRHREVFDIRTGVTLDPVAMAETAADMTLEVLLHPARATRLVEQHARNVGIPDLEFVLGELVNETWGRSYANGLSGQVERAVGNRMLEHLMRLSQNEAASQSARDVTLVAILRLRNRVENRALSDWEYRSALHRIEQFLEDPEEYTPEPAPDLPPGSPIGAGHESCSVSER